ncbi:MAG TPA: trypsin-like peptidase domain-containing protein [Phycisphaerae bacterium]|nr:trypsin-like peptidase domain-containing protein [Phycisphaerae bacterium]
MATAHGRLSVIEYVVRGGVRHSNVCQSRFNAALPWCITAVLLLATRSLALQGQSSLDLPVDGNPADVSRLSKVFGTDSRQQVKSTTSPPWSAIGLVVSTWENRGTWVGTGVMIGRQTVLTCGHNVCDPAERWADSILFVPGKNGTSEPFGRISVVQRFAWDAWIQKGDGQYDLALLVLASPIGIQTGQMDYAAQLPAFFSNRLLNSAGYPGDLAVEYGMYSESATAREADGNLILHTLDATAGQSGSPLWSYDAKTDTRTIVGVMRGSRTTTIANGTTVEWNVAVRITEQFEAWIADLIAEYDGGSTNPSHAGTGSTAATLGHRSDGSGSLVPACGAGSFGPLALTLATLPLLKPSRRSGHG